MDALMAATDTTVLGVSIVMLGGLAGAVFYLPFKKVKNWAWESYWLIYALFGLLIVPWVLAFFTSPNLISTIMSSPSNTLLYCFLCGAAWGLGGLTWGLMIRYLGVGLGLAIGCGLVASVGTIVPKAIAGGLGDLLTPGAGIASLVGIIVSLSGIVFVGLAGMSKEGELSEEAKKAAVAEFNFKLGIMVAIFSGVMSSAMNFGLQGGVITEFKAQYGSQTQIVKGDSATTPAEFAGIGHVFYDQNREYWVAPGLKDNEAVTPENWRGMPVLVVVLLGGLLINAGWCLMLNIKNKTIGDYTKKGNPLLANLFFAGAAGAIWCSQFVCTKVGEPRMGKLAYMAWPVLMSSAILFSTILAIFIGEWKGTGKRTRSLLGIGLILLIASAIITGYSGYLGSQKPAIPPEEIPGGVVSQAVMLTDVNG